MWLWLYYYLNHDCNFRNLPKEHQESQIEDVSVNVSGLEDDNISLDGSITEMVASVDDSKKIPLQGSIRDRLRSRNQVNINDLCQLQINKT